jgi:ankyrin repeat protein
LLGRSAIFYAIASGDIDVLKYVVRAIDNTEAIKGEMNHQDSYGATPLDYAVMLPSQEAAEFCLAAGADSERVGSALNSIPAS